MRILHIIHSIDPRSGGPSHALRGLVQEQVRRGHQVSILTTNAQSAEPWMPDDQFRERMNNDPAFSGAELFIARGYGRTRPVARFTWTPQAYRWLRRRLADLDARPDIVHIHGVFSHLTTFAPRLARRFGVPYIMRPAGTFAPRCMALGRTAMKRWFTTLFVAKDLRLAAAVQATTPAEKDELREQFGLNNVVVIPHGVAGVKDAQTDAPAARRALNIPERAKVLLYLSRLTPKKRPDWVIQAASKLLSEYPDLFTIFAGPDAGAESQLAAAIASSGLNGQVKRFGFVTGDQKRQLFEAADVLVLPSQSENFGVVVVEAMAHRLPVVVTPGVASHIYVDASGCGLTVEDSVDALTDGIKKILQADKTELGQRGREYVRQHLTWIVVSEKISEVYAAIIRNQRTRRRNRSVNQQIRLTTK
ncbi:Glycosyltransferase MshA involved in mycothiol biosynthesis [Thermogutta terrifontis]|uniref:Glycosyltransferase MshA involved in mycothiol biosynthesis n=1 Tax=Thermogutta terrifontis TaxID=1331910 RepID=A0A286RG84_9BACT|nr:glycosyltransferase [Thermogutta terrifontis]ASV74964.1 Glycosyltransferase MshA involved in mycothiol biosynthesis [Thermogutta terrifontis]